MAPDARPTPPPSAVVPAQNRSDRARRRDVGLPASSSALLIFRPPQTSLLRARTPSTFASTAAGVWDGAEPRSPRSLGQPRQTLPPRALQPLVAGRRTDPETPAQLPNVGPLNRGKHHKLPPLIHRRHPAKWHPDPSRSADRKSVHHVPERVSTMSPVYTRRGWGVLDNSARGSTDGRGPPSLDGASSPPQLVIVRPIERFRRPLA